MHDLLSHFPGAKREGAGWAAKCPAHPDERASLAIGQGADGKALLHCFAGCELSAILAAADLDVKDLFPATTTSTTRTIAAVYRYCNQGGLHLYDVVRFSPKGFAQRAASGSWSMAGIPRVLYRLPELQGQSVVYVTEGEKDADRVHADFGLSSTTAPGGAGRWLPAYAEQLVAAAVTHVVILPDHDEPGHRHAADVAASCHHVGLIVKVVPLPDLPPKGDVSTWIAAGHTKADLVRLVKATAVYAGPTVTPVTALVTGAGDFALTSIGDLLNEPEETVDWLVDGRITAGGLALMAAKPKVGKSTAARALALAVARGGRWLGHQCEAGMVWYLAFEGRRRDVRAHFRQMGATEDDALRVFVGQAPKDVVAVVRRLADQERPALVIIDTMQRFLRAQSTDDYAEMTTLLDAVIGIAQQSGATMLLLHHAGKADRASLDAVLGSTAITGSADTILMLSRNERYRTIATVQRHGDDLEDTVISLDEATGIVTLGGSRQDADLTMVGDQILAVLRTAEAPMTEADLEEAVDARTALQRRALRDLVSREQVTRTGKGGKGDPFRYAVARSCSHVPYIYREQENNHVGFDSSSITTPTDSCSHVRTQDSCSREKVEL